MSSTSEQEVNCHVGIIVVSCEGLTSYILRESHLHNLSQLVLSRQLLGVVLCPFGCLLVELLNVILVHLGNNCILWIIWLRCTQECLQ